MENGAALAGREELHTAMLASSGCGQKKVLSGAEVRVLPVPTTDDLQTQDRTITSLSFLV